MEKKKEKPSIIHYPFPIQLTRTTSDNYGDIQEWRPPTTGGCSLTGDCACGGGNSSCSSSRVSACHDFFFLLLRIGKKCIVYVLLFLVSRFEQHYKF